MFVDSHAHLDGPEFDADRDEVLTRAWNSDVCAILNVGTGDPHSGVLERALTLAAKHDNIYAAIGTHPHDARFFDFKAEEQIQRLIGQHTRVIAWGEIGLDFHYDNSPRDSQRHAFQRQLQLARQSNLPVIIHTREAEDATVEILEKQWEGCGLAGVMHCFSGSARLARRMIELGFFISFSGIITFKKAKDLRAVARQVPLDRLLIETDSPYLSPVPFRGKRNEPVYVVEVARCLAAIHGLDLEEMGRITTHNFARLFGLRVPKCATK